MDRIILLIDITIIITNSENNAWDCSSIFLVNHSLLHPNFWKFHSYNNLAHWPAVVCGSISMLSQHMNKFRWNAPSLYVDLVIIYLSWGVIRACCDYHGSVITIIIHCQQVDESVFWQYDIFITITLYGRSVRTA